MENLDFVDSEGFGNLLLKLGVAIGALLNPTTEISKNLTDPIGEFDKNNDGILTKAEVPPKYQKYLSTGIETTPELFKLRLAQAAITKQISELEKKESDKIYDIKVEHKVKELRHPITPFKTKNIMFDHESGSTKHSVVLTFINPKKHTIGDLLGNSQEEISKIKSIYRKAYPKCTDKMCRYRFAYINDFDYYDDESMYNQMYDAIFNPKLSKIKLADTIVKFSDSLAIKDLEQQQKLQNANLIAKLYAVGAYGNTNYPRYIDYMLGTKLKDLQYRDYFSSWFIYEKVKSIDNEYNLRLSADTEDISTKLTDNKFKLKMLDDLSLVYIKAIELTGIAFIDLHTGNFGYDSKGNLKIIDYDNSMGYSPWPLDKARNSESFEENYDTLVTFLSNKLKNTIKTDIMGRYIYECYMDQHKDNTFFGRDAYLTGGGISDLSYSRVLTTDRASELGVTDRKVLPMAHKSILLGRAVKNLFGDNPTVEELERAEEVWKNYDAFNKESDGLEYLVNDKAVHVPTIDSITKENPRLIGYASMKSVRANMRNNIDIQYIKL